MIPLIEQRREELHRLCAHYEISRLYLFGSATGENFDPNRSDLDFLVEFGDVEPSKYADTYFGLLEGLQNLFHRPVDLVMASAVRNPYLRRRIDETQTELYAA